jgi:hypothetical protein
MDPCPGIFQSPRRTLQVSDAWKSGWDVVSGEGREEERVGDGSPGVPEPSLPAPVLVPLMPTPTPSWRRGAQRGAREHTSALPV